MTRIETPEEMAARLWPDDGDVPWGDGDPLAWLIAAIRADREQIRAALLDFAEAIEENVPDLADVLADLRALAAKLGGTDG